MSEAYRQLLDATIGHLESLKQRGVRHVDASPDLLRALAQPTARASAPATGQALGQAQAPVAIPPSRSDEPSVYNLPEQSAVDKAAAMEALALCAIHMKATELIALMWSLARTGILSHLCGLASGSALVSTTYAKPASSKASHHV